MKLNDRQIENIAGYFVSALAGALLLLAAYGNFAAGTDVKITSITALVLYAATAFAGANSIGLINAGLTGIFLFGAQLAYSIIYCSNSASTGFMMWGRGIELWFPAFCLAINLILIVWISFGSLSLVNKGIFILTPLYSAAGFINAIAAGATPDYVILGTGIFKKFPAIAQPAYVFFNLTAPTAIIITFVLFFLSLKNDDSGREAAGHLITALTLITITVCGVSIMEKYLIKNIASAFIKRQVISAYGKIKYDSAWDVDAKGRGSHDIEIFTSNYKPGSYDCEINASIIPPDDCDATTEVVFSLKSIAGKGSVINIGGDDLIVKEDCVSYKPWLMASSKIEDMDKIILCLDHSGSMSKDLQKLKEAACQFVMNTPAGFKIKVVSFADAVNDRTKDFLIDKKKICGAVNGITLGSMTVMYDALWYCIDEIENKGAGKGIIVLFTDGSDAGSKKKAEEIVRRVNGGGVKIYSIGLGSCDEQIMKKISGATNGRYFHSKDSKDLQKAFSQVLEYVSCKYTIRYKKKFVDPPGIAIMTPHENQVFKNSMDIKTEASGKIAKVEFLIDDIPFKTFNEKKTSAFQSLKISTVKMKGGKHKLTAIAGDIYKRRSEKSVFFTVENDKPIPSISLPVKGFNAGSKLEIKAGISSQNFKLVNFEIDGKPVKSFEASDGLELTAEIELGELKKGPHKLSIKSYAYDGSLYPAEVDFSN